MKLCFVIDEQLPPALAQHLRSEGYDAIHVYETGIGGATDDAVAREAVARKAILITKDADFVTRSNLATLSSPIIWIRLGNVTDQALWTSLQPILPAILDNIKHGARVVEVL